MIDKELIRYREDWDNLAKLLREGLENKGFKLKVRAKLTNISLCIDFFAVIENLFCLNHSILF
jgi:hypothetical protein